MKKNLLVEQIKCHFLIFIFIMVETWAWIILYLKTSFLPVRESSKGASALSVESVSIPIDQWVEVVLPFIFFISNNS